MVTPNDVSKSIQWLEEQRRTYEEMGAFASSLKAAEAITIYKRNTDRTYLVRLARDFARKEPGVRFRVVEATFEVWAPRDGLVETSSPE